MSFSRQERRSFELMIERFADGTLDMRKMIEGEPPVEADWEYLQDLTPDHATMVWKAKRGNPNNSFVEWRNGFYPAPEQIGTGLA